MGLLELLRLALVTFVAILLNQPEWIEEFRPEEKPAIAVLWDASASMDTRDAIAGGGDRGCLRRRRDSRSRGARRSPSWLQEATWQKLRERMNVVIQPFAEPKPGHGTDLNDPLDRRAAKDPEPAGDRAGFRRRLERGAAAGAGSRRAADEGRAHLCGAGGKPDALAGRRAA